MAQANTYDGAVSMSLRPVMDGGLVGRLTVEPDALFPDFAAGASSANVRFIFILDRSGSMGESVSRIVTEILPRVCARLGVPKGAKVCVIAFDNVVEICRLTTNEMRECSLHARGGTQMAGAVDAAVTEILKGDDTGLISKATSSLKALGSYISGSPKEEVVVNAAVKDPVRLLVLSDGQVFDQDQTCSASTKAADRLKQAAQVNSQAVRFFTSGWGQPDTRGMASVLSLNNVATGQVIDVESSESTDGIVERIAALFEGDGLDSMCALECDEPVLMTNPWEKNPSQSLTLRPGENYVWFKTAPKNLRIARRGGTEEASLRVEAAVLDERVSIDDISGHMKPLMDSYVARLKVLKVVNTPETIAEMQQILAYFERFEEFLQAGQVELVELLSDRSLHGRLMYMREMAKRRRASLYGLMNQIANDDKVAQLDAAQQADYLRNVGGGNASQKNTRALARRAMNTEHGLDFGATLRDEVRKMRDHVNMELDDVKDDGHAVSFYSMETTLEGIRTLCELTDEELEEMTPTQIIQLANIVGVPCAAPIGNFVDPMTWRIDTILPGIYLSLSDVLMAHLQGQGQALAAPGHPDVEVTNVIPVFDNEKVFHFLKRHARCLLEYTASIGMRRVLAEVPMTFTYTLVSAVWKLVDVVSKKPSEVNVRLLSSVAKDLHYQLHGKFDNVLDLIAEADASSEKTLYLDYNGVMNMLDPILALVSRPEANMLRNADKHAAVRQHLHRVLRAVYSHEVYMAMRRMIKYEKAEDMQPQAYIQNTLRELLGIDVESTCVKVKPLFEAEPEEKELAFHDEVTLNEEKFGAIQQKLRHVDNIALLPSVLACVGAEDPLVYAKENVTALDAQGVCDALGLSVEPEVGNARRPAKRQKTENKANDQADDILRRFVLANVVQAFVFPSKQARQDDENKVTKIDDLGPHYVQECVVRDYIVAQHRAKYKADLAAKEKREHEELVSEIVNTLVGATSIDDFCRLLRDGKSRAYVTEVIKSASHPGYTLLRDALLSMDSKVPLRLEKLEVVLIGRDANDEPVFNGGNAVRPLMNPVKKLCKKLGEEAKASEILERYKQFVRHTYRTGANGEDVPNGHGHSNSFPSYFALGYKTLADMAASVSKEEMLEYARLHSNCCGVSQAREVLGLD